MESNKKEASNRSHLSREDVDSLWDEAFNDDTALGSSELKKAKKRAKRLYAELNRKRKIQMTPTPSRNSGLLYKLGYAAAAVLLLGLLIPAIHFFRNTKTEQTLSVVQYGEEAVTGRGEIKTVVLPDQTKVTLNVESSLKYPAVFEGERKVELKGEAIFEVTPDSERPFTVATTDMNVSVLGTIFDVKAYPDDELAIVSVASGKVKVALGHAPLSANTSLSSSAPLILEKNDQLKIDKASGNIEKHTIDAENYQMWTNGVLYFSRTPIREVVNMLNRSYPQMVFELAEGEYPDLITGRLDLEQMKTNLDPVFRSLGLNYKKTEKHIILYQDITP